MEDPKIEWKQYGITTDSAWDFIGHNKDCLFVDETSTSVVLRQADGGDSRFYPEALGCEDAIVQHLCAVRYESKSNWLPPVCLGFNSGFVWLAVWSTPFNLSCSQDEDSLEQLFASQPTFDIKTAEFESRKILSNKMGSLLNLTSLLLSKHTPQQPPNSHKNGAQNGGGNWGEKIQENGENINKIQPNTQDFLQKNKLIVTMNYKDGFVLIWDSDHGSSSYGPLEGISTSAVSKRGSYLAVVTCAPFRLVFYKLLEGDAMEGETVEESDENGEKNTENCEKIDKNTEEIDKNTDKIDKKTQQITPPKINYEKSYYNNSPVHTETLNRIDTKNAQIAWHPSKNLICLAGQKQPLIFRPKPAKHPFPLIHRTEISGCEFVLSFGRVYLATLGGGELIVWDFEEYKPIFKCDQQIIRFKISPPPEPLASPFSLMLQKQDGLIGWLDIEEEEVSRISSKKKKKKKKQIIETSAFFDDQAEEDEGELSFDDSEGEDKDLDQKNPAHKNTSDQSSEYMPPSNFPPQNSPPGYDTENYIPLGEEIQKEITDLRRSTANKFDSIQNALKTLMGVMRRSWVQRPFQPASTEEPEDAALPWCLYWTNLGHISRTSEGGKVLVEVVNHFAKDKNFRKISPSHNVTLAAMSLSGFAFASSPSTHASPPAVLEYTPFEPMGRMDKTRWEKVFEKNEQIDCLAVGEGFVTIMTACRYLYIYTIGGMTVSVTYLRGLPVALCASHNSLLILTSAFSVPTLDMPTVTKEYRVMWLTVPNLSSGASEFIRGLLVYDDVLGIPGDGHIDWVGLSTVGWPCISLSHGQILSLLPTWRTATSATLVALQFVPILNLSQASRDKQAKFSPIYISHNMVHVIRHKKGEEHPKLEGGKILFGLSIEKLPFRLPLPGLVDYHKWKAILAADPSLTSEASCMGVEQYDELRLVTDMKIEFYDFARNCGLGATPPPEDAPNKLANRHDKYAVRLFKHAKDQDHQRLAADVSCHFLQNRSLEAALKSAALDPRPNNRLRPFLEERLALVDPSGEEEPTERGRKLENNSEKLEYNSRKFENNSEKNGDIFTSLPRLSSSLAKAPLPHKSSIPSTETLGKRSKEIGENPKSKFARVQSSNEQTSKSQIFDK